MLQKCLLCFDQNIAKMDLVFLCLIGFFLVRQNISDIFVVSTTLLVSKLVKVQSMLLKSLHENVNFDVVLKCKNKWKR